MTDRLDVFRRELLAAANRNTELASSHPATLSRTATRTKRIRRSVVAGGAVFAVAALVAVTTDVGGAHTDPLAAAAAALDPEGQVVHIILEGGPVGSDGRSVPMQLSTDGRGVTGTLGRRIEQWSSADPLRFRSTQDVSAPDGHPLGTSDQGITAGGSAWSDLSWDGKRPEVQPLNRAAPNGDGANVGAFGTTDPAGLVRRELAAGHFTEKGRTTVAGTAAIRLVSQRTIQQARDGQPPVVRRLVYVVDENTFAPLELDIYRTMPGSDTNSTPQLQEKVRVVRYERVAISDVPRSTFAIPPSDGTTP